MKEVLFLTVIYPGCEEFLDDFSNSLANQSVKDFELLVLNDGCTDAEKLRDLSDLSVVEVVIQDMTPAQIREYGIRYAIEKGYEYLVFGDSDDWFDVNRIEISLGVLSDYDIVVNDLNISYDSGSIAKYKYLSNRFHDGQEISINDILDKNIFGLSNTAIKLKNIKMVPIDKSLVAIDWYIYSCFLLNDAKACFTNKTSTFYRQHSANTVGITEISKDYLLKGVQVKSKHYQEMSKLDDRYKKYLNKNDSFKCLLESDEGLANYIHELKINPVSSPVWWEEIG